MPLSFLQREECSFGQLLLASHLRWLSVSVGSLSETQAEYCAQLSPELRGAPESCSLVLVGIPAREDVGCLPPSGRWSQASLTAGSSSEPSVFVSLDHWSVREMPTASGFLWAWTLEKLIADAGGQYRFSDPI